MAQLTICSEDSRKQRRTLKEAVFTIGRHPDCDFVISDETVSRKHARIIKRPDGHHLEDLGSRNGTMVNGEKIDQTVLLHAGDQIGIHNEVMTFQTGVVTPASVSSDSSEFDLANQVQEFSLVEQRQLLRETISGQRFWSGTPEELGRDPQVTLQAILDVTRHLGSALDIDQLLTRVLESVFRAFPQAERAYVLKHDQQSNSLHLSAAKQRNVNDTGSLTLGPISRSIAREVLRNGSAVLSTEGDRPSDVSQNSVIDLGESSVLCAPLIGPSREPLGILYVESSSDERPFMTEDLDVVSCIAILAGQAMEHARSSLDRYRAVVNTAVDGIITIGKTGVIESVNPAAETMFGYSHQELIGKNACILVRPNDAESRMSFLEEYLQGGENRPNMTGQEFVAIRRDESTFPISLSLGEFCLNGRRHFTSVIRDDTERRMAEQQLKALNESLEQRVQERTQFVKLLQEIALIANNAETVAEALRSAMRCICGHLDWPVAHAWLPSSESGETFIDSELWYGDPSEGLEILRESSQPMTFSAGSGLIGRVMESAVPCWCSELNGNSGFLRHEQFEQTGLGVAFAFPVLVHTEVCAILEFFTEEPVQTDDELLEVMAHAGTHLGRVVERIRLQQQLVDAVWEQQRTFGQELHDSLGQELTGIRMLSESLGRKLEAQSRPEAAAAGELAELIQATQQNVRRLSKGLSPVEIFDDGLMAALEELADNVTRQSEIECVFVCDTPVEVQGNHLATHLFRIAQEAVNNAVKHSQATRIEVVLSGGNSSPRLDISDNGIGGVGEKTTSAGIGLRTMRYRANAVGGRLSISANQGRGTLVSCEMNRLSD